MTRVGLTLLAFPCFTLAASAAADVPTVDNPAEAPFSRTVALEKLWEVGGFSDAPGEFFGVIADLAVDSTGQVYLLDSQLKDVKVFAPDGSYLRTLGGEGEGPGEFLGPSSLVILPDDHLCVLQRSPARLSLFDVDGAYLGEQQVPDSLDGAFSWPVAMDCGGDGLAVMGYSVVSGEGYFDYDSRLYLVSLATGEATPIVKNLSHYDFARKVVTETTSNPLRFQMAPDGRLFVVNGYDYAIEVYGPGGSPTHVITRDYPHRQRSRAELDAVRGYYRRVGNIGDSKLELSDYDRDIQWTGIAGDGRLWVLSSRGLDAGSAADSLGRFDVYGRNGHLEETVELKGEGDLARDRYAMIDDRFYVTRRYADAVRTYQVSRRAGWEDEDGEPEPMSVICYKLPAAARH